MALNRGKVKNFVLGTRKIYKGWAHGYLGAVRTVRGDMVRTVAAGVKSTLGPSAVYACSMQVATSAMGLPSLVSVGAANVATPVVVAKLGGRLRNLSAQSLTARAMPIAAHFLIEFGLYDKIKHWMDSRNASASHPWVPNAHGRVTNAVRGAVSGGVCAFGATALTAVALSPYYGRRLISRAVTCSDVPTAARLGTAALRVTRIRLADSLQQGVVWFATYEAMRAATAKMEDETEWKRREEDAVVPARVTRHARGVFTTARVAHRVRSAPADVAGKAGAGDESNKAGAAGSATTRLRGVLTVTNDLLRRATEQVAVHGVRTSSTKCVDDETECIME